MQQPPLSQTEVIERLTRCVDLAEQARAAIASDEFLRSIPDCVGKTVPFAETGVATDYASAAMVTLTRAAAFARIAVEQIATNGGEEKPDAH